MRIPEEPDLPFQINLVSMLDVIFCILAFFILSSVFLQRSQGLNLNLPSAQTAVTQNGDRFTLSLTKDGTLTLDRQPLTLETLIAAIEAKSQGKAPLVVLQADSAVSHGQVIAVMDQLRQIPRLRLAIATEPQP